jgi:hypothetical protein
MVVADYDEQRAQRAAAEAGATTADPRFVPTRVDASYRAAVAGLLRDHRCDVLLNATDPRFVMPLFRAALEAKCTTPATPPTTCSPPSTRSVFAMAPT